MNMKYFLYAFLGMTTIFSFGQQNYRSENYGNRSILLNGNVTGSVEDLGLTIYNPARLALVDNPVFSVNAKVYELTDLRFEAAGAIDETLSNSNFDGIPSLLAGTFEIGDWKDHYFAYSFVTKSRLGTNLDFGSGVRIEDIIESLPGEETYLARLGISTDYKDEWFGVTWATEVRPNFSVGISTFLSISTNRPNAGIRFGFLLDNDTVASQIRDVSYDSTFYGLVWKVGLAYRSSNNWEYGINLTPPYLQLFGDSQIEYEEILSGVGPEDDRLISVNLDNLESQFKRPLGVSFGMGIPWKKNKFHLSAEWHGGIDAYDVTKVPTLIGETGEEINISIEEELRPVVNAGLGAELYLNKSFNLYLGFSTDFSPYKQRISIFDLVSDTEDESENAINLTGDFFNYSFGIDYKAKWASIVVGANYTRSSDSFEDPFTPGDEPVTGNTVSKIILTQWNFLIGIDIGFVKDLENKFKGEEEEEEKDENSLPKL